MKKASKLLALLIAVLMVASIQLPAMAVEIGDKVENIPTLSIHSSVANSSQMMAENDKYIFVAIGSKGNDFRTDSAIKVYSKATGELIRTIELQASGVTLYVPVRDMYVKDDVLFVAWGHAVSADGSAARALVSSNSYTSPLIAYDVANVTADAAPKQIVTDRSNAYLATHAPFNWGGIAYLDEDTSTLYGSKVVDKSTGTRHYTAFTTSEIKTELGKTTVPAGITITKKFKNTDAASLNTAQFMVKDGWFFEVLQEKGGLVGTNTANTLNTNNQVRVYDIRSFTPSNSSPDIKGLLRGTYTTATTGNVAIRDIEVVGNYMYVATQNGIEVVDLAPAKSATTNTTLTAVTTVSEANIGGVADIDAIGNYLFAGYTGPQYYGSYGSASEAGALVVYNITTPNAPAKVAEKSVEYGVVEMSVDEANSVVYVLNDVSGPPAMTAFSYNLDAGEEEEFEFTAIKLGDNKTLTAGIFDISVELTNPDVVTGTVICAVYEGDKLVNVFVNDEYAGETSVLMAEDYTVSGTVTEIKAMFLDSLTGELRPLIPSISISK